MSSSVLLTRNTSARPPHAQKHLLRLPPRRNAPCHKCHAKTSNAPTSWELAHPFSDHLPVLAKPHLAVALPNARGVVRVVCPEDVEVVEAMYQALDQARLRDATWGEPWPAAIAAAAACADRLECWNGQVTSPRVCELGCGLGIPSLAAASALSSSRRGGTVLACDWEPRALWCVAQSAAIARHHVVNAPREVDDCKLPEVNWVDDVFVAKEEETSIACPEQPQDIVAGGVDTAPTSSNAEVEVQLEALNWFDDDAVNAKHAKHSFDMVVATDVLYQPAFADAVSRCCVARLRHGSDACAEGAGVLLADATRRRGKEGIRDTFHDRLMAHDEQQAAEAEASGGEYRRLHLISEWTTSVTMDAPFADSNDGGVHDVTLRWYARRRQ